METNYQLSDPISLITLGVNNFRFQNACKAADIKTIGDLVGISYKDLLKLRNLGGMCILEAYAWLVRNKFENCSTLQPTKDLEGRSDWEARAWQLACQLFSQTWDKYDINDLITKDCATVICVDYAYELMETFKKKATERSE